MSIRLGLDSTKVLLTEECKGWFKEHYPPGIVYEYNVDGTFDLKSMGADFVEVICPMGIPYRFPNYIDGKITFRMANQEEGEG